MLFSAYKWMGILEEQKKNKENEFLVKEQAEQLKRLQAQIVALEQQVEIATENERQRMSVTH